MLANPRAGRGKGRIAAQHVADRLRAAGFRVNVVPVGPGVDGSVVAEQVARSNAVVAAGGDGTVHHAAAAILASARTGQGEPPPIYHLPWGNENLFAREFGMDRHAATLVRALRKREIRVVDVAWIRPGIRSGGSESSEPVAERRPTLFLIMAGFGPDASVIHRLDASRSRAVGHLAYVRPILAELRAPSFPRVRVVADGREIVDGCVGMLVVANCRQYASRLNPARGATMTDGLLDVVFMPCATVHRALGWAVRCRFGRQGRRPDLVAATGREVHVERCDGSGDLPCQVDGESLRGGPSSRFAITVEPGVLPVLLP